MTSDLHMESTLFLITSLDGSRKTRFFSVTSQNCHRGGGGPFESAASLLLSWSVILGSLLCTIEDMLTDIVMSYGENHSYRCGPVVRRETLLCKAESNVAYRIERKYWKWLLTCFQGRARKLDRGKPKPSKRIHSRGVKNALVE
jgi:hypothetical protein